MTINSMNIITEAKGIREAIYDGYACKSDEKKITIYESKGAFYFTVGNSKNAHGIFGEWEKGQTEINSSKQRWSLTY